MITIAESIILKGLIENEFHNGSKDVVNEYQWFMNPFDSKHTASGVCSSLTKKGFMKSVDEGTKDHAACITQAGMDAYNEYVTYLAA